MNRSSKNLKVQSNFEFDTIISQLDSGSPLTQIQTKKFSGIKNLDLFEIQDDQYETPKESFNSLMEEDLAQYQRVEQERMNYYFLKLSNQKKYEISKSSFQIQILQLRHGSQGFSLNIKILYYSLQIKFKFLDQYSLEINNQFR
ncbi:unnamed protein product (macronuclear) [Paramecium tetraurelia]|uniref:Uncharacterized protein n=1 Tax=Paramecium tetraurelia TaxID=5888 RepID=A0EB31_PARTE|nr:uncharacterized protein GSPATT00025232001 [Paramecium tetraurelia]CAK92498.1 unnamed protein product [Paramecium tetraurelia]|eukprot:XP_001459895.1 hypothetical protein (macronuclear) [Paramecium tetraurelia strain d4-2]